MFILLLVNPLTLFLQFRVPLPTLMKCETALERMFDKNADKSNLLQPSSIPPSSTISSSSSTAAASAAAAIANQGDPRGPESNPPQSQSLLDFKMTYSPPPTYSNLKDIVSHINNTFDRLPTTKRRCLNREQGDFDTGVNNIQNMFFIMSSAKWRLI